jgi:mRNA-decapping enzyme subunit 2
MNLPLDDLSSAERICFHLEEAQWFYEDFIRPLDPTLPSMNLRRFCERMFAHCPTLSIYSPETHMAAFEHFLQYKSRIPVRGAIMLNEAMDSAVLVKGWKKGANWSFPRGKINLEEDDLTCAMREVYEETGYNLETSGLVPEDRNVKYIEITMREQQIRLYVFKNVPMDTHFEPRTRKEISKIEWWPLSDLPAFRKKGRPEQQENVVRDNKFYNVAPFLVPLRKWIIEQKKQGTKRDSRNQYLSAGVSYDELQTEEEQGTDTNGAAGLYTASPLPTSDLELDERSLRLQREIFQMQQPKEPAGRADALFALLKSNPPTSNPQVSAQGFPPHTPLEHSLDQAPMPRTPYHQHPPPPEYSSMPPPPTFPIQPQHETFSYQQAGLQNARQPAYLEHAYNQNQQQIQRSHENPHSYQSQHLVHPQPLPLHVQRAVFTGGPVHSPMMPQPVEQQPPHQLTSTVSVTVNNPQFPGLHAPMVPPAVRQAPPKLTEHHLSLLNALKGKKDDTDGNPSAANDLPLRRFIQEPAHPQRPPPQELPGDASRAPPIPVLPRVELQYTTNASSGLIPNMITPRQPPSEEHRSALLSMFKSPATPAAVPANPVAATALPISATPSAVELSAVEPLSQNAASTSALLNDRRTPGHSAKNRSIPELNPEANLPFRALSILPRPSELSDNEAPLRNGSGHKVHTKANGGHHARNTIRHIPAAKSPEKPFQPQILKRPQPGPSKAVDPAPVPPSTLPAFSPPSMDTRPPQTADHRQTLLSLFGKASATANPLSRIPTSDPTQQLPMAPAASVSARSRVGSLASGEAPSRRGSQVPISPADKNFLLNYLGAVTK